MTNQNMTVSNPFGARQDTGNAIAKSDEERAIQEIQAAMVVAQKFPRNQQLCVDNIIESCKRQSLAEQGLYAYPRGDTLVTGPAIRLAEMIAQNWKNMKFGIRELSQQGGMSVCQAYAWDMENNVFQEKTFQVPHIRHTRSGSKTLTDPRDIYEMVANNGARRVRACILGVVPGDVVEAAVQQCQITQAENTPVNEKTIGKLLDAFEEYGVFKEHIEHRISHNIDAMVSAELLQMKRIYQSIRDGMGKPSDYFDIVETDPNTGVTDESKKMADNIKSKGKGKNKKHTYAEIMDMLNDDKNNTPVDDILKLGSHLPQDQQKELREFAKSLIV